MAQITNEMNTENEELHQLTDEQKDDYLANPGRCPFCGSRAIEEMDGQESEVRTYGGAHYCGDECFEKTKQFMKENGIILV